MQLGQGCEEVLMQWEGDVCVLVRCLCVIVVAGHGGHRDEASEATGRRPRR